jgi:hypothetical protein
MHPPSLDRLAVSGWAPQRRAPRGSDEALTGTARHWLRQLPSRRRPIRLCQLYPRVANRIAWCWLDHEVTSQVFDDLLTDRRGGREGFPTPVVRELQRLSRYHAQQRLQADAEANRDTGWWTNFGRLAGL